MTDQEFVLEKNQVEILEWLVQAKSSEDHPVNLKAAYGFKIHHNESDDQIKKYKDYLAISNHGQKPVYIAENAKGAWITKSGKEALAKFKAEEKKKKK